jgi:drug/metabolite transporter (DMT)-like permease
MIAAIFDSGWFPFGLGVFMLIIGALIIGFPMMKVVRNEYITKDEMIMVGPMLIFGMFGPIITAIGLGFAFEHSNFPFWAYLIILFLFIYFAAALYCINCIGEHRNKAWRPFE